MISGPGKQKVGAGSDVGRNFNGQSLAAKWKYAFQSGKIS
jgi:hypothetical protein